MVIPVPCNEVNFYRAYVELLNPIIKLRNRELDVLAQLMYYYNEYRELPKDIRSKMVFDYSTKVKITKALGISMDVLNNNLSELRKKGQVVDNDLIKPLQVFPEGGVHRLSFQFNIDGKNSDKGSGEVSPGTTPEAQGLDSSSRAVGN